MIYRGEQDLADKIADGRITVEDADIVRAFGTFLRETPNGLTHANGADWPGLFPDRAAFEAWRTRWLPYLAGLADGPTTAEEYAELRPRLLAGGGGEKP